MLDDILNDAPYQQEADFIIEATINQYTKEEIYKDFTKNMVNWYLYLKMYLPEEKFELCAKIRDVIELEKIEFLTNIKFHSEYTSEEEEQQLVQDTDTLIKSMLSK